MPNTAFAAGGICLPTVNISVYHFNLALSHRKSFQPKNYARISTLVYVWSMLRYINVLNKTESCLTVYRHSWRVKTDVGTRRSLTRFVCDSRVGDGRKQCYPASWRRRGRGGSTPAAFRIDLLRPCRRRGLLCPLPPAGGGNSPW